MIDATRNGWRWIDPIDRPGRETFELRQKERIMRAGKRYAIGALTIRFDETRRDFTRDLFIGDRLALHIGLGQTRKVA
jgi:hypothetical protein